MMSNQSDALNVVTSCLPIIQLKQVLTDQTEELRSTRVEGLRKVRELKSGEEGEW